MVSKDDLNYGNKSHLSFGSRFKGLRHHKWASLDLWQYNCLWDLPKFVPLEFVLTAHWLNLGCDQAHHQHFCIIRLVVFTSVVNTIIQCIITSSTTSSSIPTCVTSSVARLGTWSSSWSELSGVSGNIRELFRVSWKEDVILNYAQNN